MAAAAAAAAARVGEAVRLARQVQPAWGSVPVGDRAKIVSRFGELINEHTEECAAAVTRDTGKPITQARNEVKATVKRVTFFAEAAAEALKARVVKSSSVMNEVIKREPLGVVANVSAWNYVWFIGTNVWAPGLVAGNAVIYKPSEHALGTARLVGDLWREAGVTEGVFQTLDGDAEVGRALVDADVDGIFFTGSYATGQQIARAAAPRMVKLQLELGGKDAAYVADDVKDPADVAAKLADGAMYNTGQSCCSVERIYVHERVYEPFVEALVAEVNSFKVGDPWDASTFVGPLCLPSQPAFLEAQVQDALAKGATRLAGFAPPPTPRHFPPTVLVDVDHSMDVARHESFGPVVAVMKVADDDEALALVNDSYYGLTAAIYCADEDRAMRFLAGAKTGSAYWNCCDRTSPFLPWSGRGASGVGVTMSNLGIQTFTHARGYHLNRPPS
ncbi:hypothetical protein CTAYLR_006471 [Chrysophaeum taylorii]|uniref:Aldehyde dehydrogenase domain-containing protein n=1 Tax=Chrysophaeum taylorii TaxID=2483200 RepID=A0AAD7XQC3_9STRA|nr:hypothetical protein CTAYLR_006471 [Chrysophaeum taylorii]